MTIAKWIKVLGDEFGDIVIVRLIPGSDSVYLDLGEKGTSSNGILPKKIYTISVDMVSWNID